MNQKELIDLVSAETGFTKADTKRIATALSNAIYGAIAAHEAPVDLLGLGTIKTSPRAARNARNPRTGETVYIPAKVAVKITPSALLKRAANFTGLL